MFFYEMGFDDINLQENMKCLPSFKVAASDCIKSHV